ncbi:histone-fold-containing protein [Melanogaster broomeanus]|nr:histone-fold-containing protein [Melanogaster broomeanus]
MPRKDASGGPISAQAQQDLVSEGIENFELPKSLVTKIAKSAVSSSIPDNAKLQKETVLSLVKGSTVFINYLGEHSAHDVALSKQHKSISASDVLKALEMIEFGDLVDMLQAELQVYRDTSKGDKGRKSGADRNTGSVKGKGKEGESVSSASRPKGKEKAPPPPPFTTVPRPIVTSSISHTTQDVDTSVRTGEDEEAGEGVGDEEDVEDEVEEIDEVEDDEVEEETVDMMAVETEELIRDAAGLDKPEGDPGDN